MRSRPLVVVLLFRNGIGKPIPFVFVHCSPDTLHLTRQLYPTGYKTSTLFPYYTRSGILPVHWPWLLIKTTYIAQTSTGYVTLTEHCPLAYI